MGGKSNPNIFAITASLLLLWVTISTTSALSMTLTQDGNFGGMQIHIFKKNLKVLKIKFCTG